MPYSDPGAVTTGTTITSTWGNAVRAAEQYLANPPQCRVSHNTTQGSTSGTEFTMAYNTEAYDTDTMHDTVTNNSRITIKTAGVYQVSWGHSFAADTDYLFVYSYARLNGATLILYGSSLGGQTDNGASPQTTGSGQYKFAVNDYIEIRTTQKNTSAGGNAAAASAYFAATWLGLG